MRSSSGQLYSIELEHAGHLAMEAAWSIVDNALQIHSGYDFTRDFPLEGYLRDLRIFRIHEGSSEIRRTINARHPLDKCSQRSNLEPFGYTPMQEQPGKAFREFAQPMIGALFGMPQSFQFQLNRQMVY